MEEWIGGEFNYNEFNKKLRLNKELEKAKKELELIKKDSNRNGVKIDENNDIIDVYLNIDKNHNIIFKLIVLFSIIIGVGITALISPVTVAVGRFVLSSALFTILSGSIGVVCNKVLCSINKKKFKEKHFNDENITIQEMKEKIERRNKELLKGIKKNNYKEKGIEDKIRSIEVKIRQEKKNLNRRQSYYDADKDNKKYVDSDSYHIKDGFVKKIGGK